MLTSFAPSPIESVIFSGNLFLIILTISAFYYGDTLHARTTSTLFAASENFDIISGYSASIARVAPAMITAYFYRGAFSILASISEFI
jgi:hypothetical protein